MEWGLLGSGPIVRERAWPGGGAGAAVEVRPCDQLRNGPSGSLPFLNKDSR